VGHLGDVVAGHGTDVDVIRARWSSRSLRALRWPGEHGFRPIARGRLADIPTVSRHEPTKATWTVPDQVAAFRDGGVGRLSTGGILLRDIHPLLPRVRTTGVGS